MLTNNYPTTFTADTSPTVVTNVDACLDYMAFANTHTADISVTVKDGNGKTFFPSVAMPAGQLTVIRIPEGGLMFRGGLSITASVAGKVDCWLRTRILW